MPLLSQLEAEPWWDREIVTDELAALGATMRQAWGLPADAIGTKGNEVHLRGGHRSQEWIRNSRWCTDRAYTVQAGLTADQIRHVAAFDVTPGEWGTPDNRQRMITITGRIVAARKAGKLPEITEVFGTLDGTTVYGGADSSHLDHLHLTFDRRQLHNAELMTRVANILQGDDMALRDDADGHALIDRVASIFSLSPSAAFGANGKAEPNQLASLLLSMKATLSALAGKDWVNEQEIVTGVLAGLASLTPEAIADHLAAVLPADLAKQVADELAARLAQ